ncbi:DUF3307 domain-containing protein [Serpentinicella alkaliphila]|uniref:Uncharacterized protein DUF3307 n=1 Tax=Serpentinicella alkaliphila TaxID=1734049 RepID=A0A4R2SZR3_9FIRM|nr:DUF3307 domain-containing protein [Serpentinicella alkaliphila]QUH26426.1 DUF3307 domain-containing protein [Serpentinicella alkaliphila]TCP95260.1 uncharacterized protein DUF3307 [Serpentinicella alkaliphila]
MFTLLMLISHTISDFIIQTDSIVNLKSNLHWRGFLYHGIGLSISSICMILLAKASYIPKLISVIFIIVLIHLLIDFSKEKLQRIITESNNNERIKKAGIITFVLDQILHLLVILLLTNNVTIEFNELNEVLLRIFNQNGLTQLDLKIIFIILYIAFSGAYLIPLIFDLIYMNISDYNKTLNDMLKEDVKDSAHKFIDEVKAGKWIGILERILITFFIYNNQLNAIGFIIAMKSLARFKMLDSKIFSEYYLIGTLFSIVYTFFGFHILQRIL